MLDLLLLVHPGLEGCFPELSLFLGIGGIVSQEGGHTAVFHLHDLGDYPVQEIPVMGHDDHSPRIVQKVRLKPGDGVHVQVVCGLVQKDDVGLGEQKLS